MKNSGWGWPVAIIAFLVGGAAVNVGFMLVATRDASFAVEPDYYRKAVQWDQTMAQEAENATLGWTIAMTLDGARHGAARVSARVTDRDGGPIEGARVGVEAFHSARASRLVVATLAAEPRGQYAATLALDRPGLWELRVRIERGHEVFTRTIDQLVPRMP